MKLEDLAEISSGQGAPQEESAFSDNGYPFIRAGNLESLLVSNDEYASCKLINPVTAQKYKLYLFPRNTIVFAKSGMSATKGRIYSLMNDSYIVNHLATVLPNPKLLHHSYLKYFLIFFSPSRLIKDSAYPSISLTDVKQIQIPLPPIEEQHRIVKILDLAQSLIEKRKLAISYLDDYIKAVFLDMFGDPVSNPKGWEVRNLGELVSEFRYGTNTISDTKKTDFKLPILRIPNIIGEKINYQDLKYSIVEEKEKEKIKLIAGDLLFVRSNGNPAYIGRCAVFEGHIECGYASYLIRARLTNEENSVYPKFLRDVISFPTYRRLVLEKAKTTAGNYNINIESLKSLKIYVPPMKLQESFISISKLTESLKQKMESQLKELGYNFQAQLQRAFKPD